jgi:methyl-accepting chemotaxis protein
VPFRHSAKLHGPVDAKIDLVGDAPAAAGDVFTLRGEITSAEVLERIEYRWSIPAGVELVSEPGKALQRIIGRIAEISTLVSQIATAADQQANGLQQVNTAVSEMDGVTQQNAAMVEEATAAARSLSTEADELARHVARFKIENGTSHAANGNGASNQPVHRLQQRAADAGRRLAAQSRGGRSAAVAVAADDWSEF